MKPDTATSFTAGAVGVVGGASVVGVAVPPVSPGAVVPELPVPVGESVVGALAPSVAVGVGETSGEDETEGDPDEEADGLGVPGPSAGAP
ncbi:hypothetical protein, partial [Streptomyces sp. NPDC054756]